MSTTHPHLEKNTFNVSCRMSVVSVCTHVSVCLHFCVSVLARNCEPKDTITLHAPPPCPYHICCHWALLLWQSDLDQVVWTYTGTLYNVFSDKVIAGWIQSAACAPLCVQFPSMVLVVRYRLAWY